MKFYQKNVHRPILVGYKHSATSKLATRFCTSLWNERSPKPATFKGKTWFSLRENLIFLWFFSLFFQKFPTKYLFHSTKKNIDFWKKIKIMKLEKTYLNCFLLAEFHSGSWDSNVVRTKSQKTLQVLSLIFGEMRYRIPLVLNTLPNGRGQKRTC